MGGPEAVLHRTQQPMTGEAIPLEGEHGIHQMLQHLRARQHPLLGHMTHQQKRRGLAFGKPLQCRGALTHLTHRARSTAEIGVMQSLDAVDDRHLRLQCLQLLKNQIQIGLRQQLQIGGTTGQSLPAQLHLLS